MEAQTKTCALLGSDLHYSPCLHLFVLYLCSTREERFNFQTKVEIGVGKAFADASQGISES